MARSRSSATDNKPKPRSDAYVGLLFISLLAQIAAAVFFYLDFSQYPTVKPPDVKIGSAPSAPAGGGQQGGGQQGGQAGAQQGGQAGAQQGGMAGAQQGGMAGAQQGGMAGMAGDK